MMRNPDGTYRGFQIPVEDAVERVVRQVGGLPVKDLLPTGVDLPRNADFVFQKYGVVGELKRLKKNQSEDIKMSAKMQQLYNGWVAQRRRVPIVYGRAAVNLRSLPADCAEEMLSVLKVPILRRIRKANEQIKSTKRDLHMEDAVGLLLLAQDGDYSIGPEAVFCLVARSLKAGPFRGIDHVIHFNANVPASRPNDSLGYMFWAHARRDENGPELPHELFTSLSDAWRAELEATIGTAMINPDDPPELETLLFPKSRR
jgi:hypothetical protein